mgnify:CR=1 FL=1
MAVYSPSPVTWKKKKKNARLGIEYRMEKREMSNLETISENTQIVEISTAIKREIINVIRTNSICSISELPNLFQ